MNIDRSLRVESLTNRLNKLKHEIGLYILDNRPDPNILDFKIHTEGALETLTEVISREQKRVDVDGAKAR